MDDRRGGGWTPIEHELIHQRDAARLDATTWRRAAEGWEQQLKSAEAEVASLQAALEQAGVEIEHHRTVRSRLSASVASMSDRNARLLSGDYCEHGLDCPGTGPDCAKAGTLAEARQRGWDEAIALSDVITATAELDRLRALPWDLIERTANEARNFQPHLNDDEASAVERFALHLLATRETEESTCCPTCGSGYRSSFYEPCWVNGTADLWHTEQSASDA